MTFVLWQRGGNSGIASTRLVLRPSEVPLLSEAQDLRDRLEALHREQSQRVASACEEARARGHAQGLEQGVLAAGDEIATTLMKLATTAEQERERLRAQVGALALHVARKLLGALAADERLVALADTAARDVLPAHTLTLVVHPDQADAVRARFATQAPRTDVATAAPLAFEVKADPTCALDACRIETELGTIDASLDAQLARLADAWGVREAA